MATRRTPSAAPHPARLSAQQMQTALPKLQRRIAELNTIDTSTIRDRGEPRFDALVQKIDDTLVEVFGTGTVEYNRFHVRTLDTAGWDAFGGTTLHEIIDGFRQGIEQATSNLQTIVDLFKEKLADAGETPEALAARTFEGLDLHPEIARASTKLFEDGHYANAVEDACKVVDLLVKMRSGRVDLSGTDLMLNVFSPKAPVLRFNALATETQKSEQQGMMYLYAGAMLALRNPRAHELLEDHPERAIEHLGFLSMLAKALD